jgi:N-acyl-D-aspartate/D-glutamate deacylase
MYDLLIKNGLVYDGKGGEPTGVLNGKLIRNLH